jgi:hypothetical protein
MPLYGSNGAYNPTQDCAGMDPPCWIVMLEDPSGNPFIAREVEYYVSRLTAVLKKGFPFTWTTYA